LAAVTAKVTAKTANGFLNRLWPRSRARVYILLPNRTELRSPSLEATNGLDGLGLFLGVQDS
jgi:hypothetical protein